MSNLLVCVFVSSFYAVTSEFSLSPSLAANGLALGEEADFEALNCLPALNLKRSTMLHLSTEPAFLPNGCYRAFFYSSISSNVNSLSVLLIDILLNVGA